MLGYVGRDVDSPGTQLEVALFDELPLASRFGLKPYRENPTYPSVHQDRNITGVTACAAGEASVAGAVAPSAEPLVIAPILTGALVNHG